MIYKIYTQFYTQKCKVGCLSYIKGMHTKLPLHINSLAFKLAQWKNAGSVENRWGL